MALSRALVRLGESELGNAVARDPMADHTPNPMTQRQVRRKE